MLLIIYCIIVITGFAWSRGIFDKKQPPLILKEPDTRGDWQYNLERRHRSMFNW